MPVDQERLERANTERIFLISSQLNQNVFEFEVMGSTGKIYKVKLDNKATCSCPDNSYRRNKCKHILFMFSKIFKVPDIEKNKYTAKEINDLVEKYKENIAKNTFNIEDYQKDVESKVRGLDGDCVICLDGFISGEKYVYCSKSCHNAFHEICHKMYSKVNKNCPCCMQVICASTALTKG